MATFRNVLPPPVERAARRYLWLLDRLLPGRATGLYVTGSVALGGYRRARSDIDLLVVIDGDLSPVELRRVRAVQVASAAATTPPAVARGLLAAPGTCNATFVRADDLTRPVTSIVPLVSHVGHTFQVGRGFDVNPVVWKTLATRGIAVRGPDPATLGLDVEAEVLRDWNRRNLNGYWKPWAETLAAKGPPQRVNRLTPRWLTAWGVLGAPRLHRTITTGDVISKEAAGDHALAVFGDEWHPVIREALTYWREEPSPDPARYRDRSVRWRETSGFVLEVVRSVA